MRHRLAGTSTRLQLTVALLGVAILAGVSPLLVAGVSAQRHLHEQLRKRLMDIASEGAASINGDLLSRLAAKADENSPAYLQLKRQLQALRDRHPGLRYVYTMRSHADPKRWSFVVDAEEDPELVSHLGDPYDISDSPEMWKGLKRPAADRQLVWDKWGCWLSGYAPIKDAHGRTAALLGLDMSAAEVVRQERAVLRSVLVALIGCLLAAGLLARYLSGVFSHPVVALAEGTQKVAGGALTTQVKVGGSRELALLGNSFNEMTQALRAQQERIVELSNTDFLTSIGNHRYFHERLDQEISRTARYRRPLSLVMLDLDHFRAANYTYSHQGGDDLLREVAKLIKDSFRGCDIATRYGGEEFAVIMPEAARSEAYEAAERVRRLIEENTFEIRALGSPAQVKLTVSIGVAEFPADSAEKDGLILAADLAMFRAKHTSRNRVCVYSEKDDRSGAHLDPSQLHRALQDASLGAVQSLAQALDARDAYTRGHSENVTRLALAISKAMGMPAESQMQLRIAGLLHDIGKIGIPDKVLNKKGPLTPREWEAIRSHPSVGASILRRAPLLADIIPTVAAHHERYGGGGYPQGISGDEIPLAARIIAVADSYDAMTSNRPYRLAMSREQALAELRANTGTQFDPAVVNLFELATADLDECQPALAAAAEK